MYIQKWEILVLIVNSSCNTTLQKDCNLKQRRLCEGYRIQETDRQFFSDLLCKLQVEPFFLRHVQRLETIGTYHLKACRPRKHECSRSAPCDPLKREPPSGTGTRVLHHDRSPQPLESCLRVGNGWRLAAPAHLQKSRARDWTSRGIILSTWATTHHLDLEVEAALADSSAAPYTWQVIVLGTSPSHPAVATSAYLCSTLVGAELRFSLTISHNKFQASQAVQLRQADHPKSLVEPQCDCQIRKHSQAAWSWSV